MLLAFEEPLREARLRIYRMDGSLVFQIDGAALDGRREVAWPRRSPLGEPLPPGVYLLHLAGRVWRDDRAVDVRTSVAWLGR
jgi:hypothetical protein